MAPNTSGSSERDRLELEGKPPLLRRPKEHASDRQIERISRLLRETELYGRLHRRIQPNHEGILIDWTFYDADRWIKKSLTRRTADRAIELIEDERYEEAALFLHDLGLPIR